MKILALDVSGSATGWAFGSKHALKSHGKFISNLRCSRGERLGDFAGWIAGLLADLQPDIILVEKPYLGRNSKVLTNLSKFVAIVELQAFAVLELEIKDEWFLTPKEVKRLMGVKTSPKSSDRYSSNKEQMVKRVNHLYGLSLKYTKNKNKKHNDDDIADAIALLSAWWQMEHA